MKEYNLKQSVVIIVVGFALLWTCLYLFVFPFLVGGGPAKVPLARSDERQLSLSIESYKQMFGNYPTGENASIVKILAGDNSQKLRMFNLNVNSTNKNGELVDPWKTAYKFVFDGTNSYTILSAGIDQKFGSADDIVFNSVSNNFVKP
jgi:Type II secretion system (T2SS), protein G